ncbi:MucB/RseB C-terminal domain-containing protein [Uliginosibacterium sp. TH139]|uniref:MucB/RseB C-terminal domain-containing protein n=1 Tax=Uliginosibacterium sp. TH139 TaxID=2067453 RepID=UPI000C7B4D94|nr:MucB/RseB C-terminal domain-containing protein [Uliginosibacterium sp. TH139]PLK47348.1 siderophore-interacting protein [Uliginosibacterium sp. TH139]
MTRRLALVLCVGLLASTPALAEDALGWLQRMNQASRNLSFTGVFVYQTQGRTETSRIVRLVDGSGEHERLETLDGTPREVLRHNENVQCFLPADKILVLDRAIQARQPGRLVSRPAALGEVYTLRVGEPGRVAGREAQILYLEPRDELRYGHQLWIDMATGLLLKSRMLAGSAGVVEQFAFTEMNPDAHIEHEKLKPQSVKTTGWRVINAAGEDVRPEDIPWLFRRLPAGFKQVALMHRKLHKDDAVAVHAAFSDGFANVSVFIEPQVQGRAQNPAPPAGPIGSYRRMLGDQQVTVLGEVPAQTLKLIAEGVERRK